MMLTIPNFNCFQNIPDCQIFNNANPNCKVCWKNCTESGGKSDVPVISCNQNIECSGSLTNCEHFEIEALPCLKCDLNFALNQTGVKCVIKIEDCFIYNDLTGLCQKCTQPLGEQRLIDDNGEKKKLNHQSLNKNYFIDILMKIGAFIDNEKMKHEYFVYRSNPLEVKIKEKIGKRKKTCES